MRPLWFAALLIGGCTATEVDVTFRFAPTIDAAKVGGGMTLSVSGDEQFEGNIGIPGSEYGDQRFIYRSRISHGMLKMRIRGFNADVAGQILGCGEGSVVLMSGAAARLDITLEPGDCPAEGNGDMGVPDDLAADLGAPDLAGADLAHGAPDGAILYDSFDNTISSNWTMLVPNGTAEIDSNFHHTGAGSLHLRIPPVGVDGGGYSQAFLVRNGLAIPDPFWMSAWVSYGANAAMYGRVGLLGLHDTANNIVGLDEDTLAPRASANGESGFTDWTSGGMFATRPAWTCVVYQVQSGASGFVTVTVDGTSYTNPEPFTLAMPLSQAWLGIDTTPIGGLPLEVWLDEVTIAAHPIGCN